MKTDIPEELAKDPWFKIVEFLQQNWAVVIRRDDDALAVFYSDTCGVFDEIAFPTRDVAEQAYGAMVSPSSLRTNERKSSSDCPEGSSRSDIIPMGGSTQVVDSDTEEAQQAKGCHPNSAAFHGEASLAAFGGLTKIKYGMKHAIKI